MKFERIKLYHYPATRSARVKWLLHELVGDDFEVERVDLYKGVQYRPEYRALNPNHNVPMLELDCRDGEKIRMLESAAMISFLADAFPEKSLAPPPTDLSARADYLQMLHFGGSWMDMMLWQIRIHEHILGKNECDQRTNDRYRRKIAEEVEPQLKARLERADYICGDAFTAADCVTGHNIFWANSYGLCADPVLGAYRARLAARPAFMKAFADLGEFKPEPPNKERMESLFTG